MTTPPDHINLFVYGTLMRGGRYHKRYCDTALEVKAAAIPGRLYALDAGYPALEISRESVLAVGSHDPVADAALADSFGELDLPDQARSWDVVHGELITLPNPRRAVPPIDRLEEFVPGGPDNLYRRVLVLVRCGSLSVPAWTYVGSKKLVAQGRRIPEGVWRP